MLANLALIGNPNCGKTTLFNMLTGSHQYTGNWPGVTVDKKSGYYAYQNKRFNVIDLPGTYAIESKEEGIAEDELVVRRFVLSAPDSLLLNIVDATNLQRGLYLTMQLLDLNHPMIVVLNMMDAVRHNNEKIDIQQLSDALGCPVIPISASRKEGLDQLRQTIAEAMASPLYPAPKLNILDKKQSIALQQFLDALPSKSRIHTMTRWALFELLLHRDATWLNKAEQKAFDVCWQNLSDAYGGEMDVALASARYSAIDHLCRRAISRPYQANKRLIGRLDRFALGNLTGIPIFLGVMYAMFWIAINFGSAFIDFFDILFGALCVEGIAHLLNQMEAPNWLITVLSNGLGGGIQTVATFVPVIGAMFLCLSFLEDSGYLARAAMVVDRGMRVLGLPGKAFVPMLVGFGCNVPAIMGTRTLENKRERLMSIMMIPYMSCGARLPVYALLVAIFFPLSGHNIVFGLYIGGITVAIVTGIILKYTILPGGAAPFIMELPPYRIPTLRNLFCTTWDRLKSFVIRAGKVIILMVVILSFFNSLGKEGTFGHEDTEQSVLSHVAKIVSPFFEPLGVQADNWPATVGIVTGIFAKEAVIGTLNALYSQMGEPVSASEENATFDLWASTKEALLTIPENLKGLFAFDALPLISTLFDGQGSIQAVAEEQGIEHQTMSKIHQSFGTQASVIAFLIFTLLYTPCVAALGAVYRETNAKWTALVGVWTFATAWMLATFYYQAANIFVTPAQSSGWLGSITVAFIVIFAILRRYGRSARASYYAAIELKQSC